MVQCDGVESPTLEYAKDRVSPSKGVLREMVGLLREIAKRPEDKGKLIVVILPHTGEDSPSTELLEGV